MKPKKTRRRRAEEQGEQSPDTEEIADDIPELDDDTHDHDCIRTKFDTG